MSNPTVYLRLDGITGTVTATGYANQIALLSAQTGVSNSVQHSTTGATSGKASFANVSLIKAVDISSIALFSHVCTGNSIATGTISVVSTTGNSPQLLYRLDFTGIIITSVSLAASSSGDSPFAESVSFAYNTMAATCIIPPTPSAPNPTSPTYGWNIATNTHT